MNFEIKCPVCENDSFYFEEGDTTTPCDCCGVVLNIDFFKNKEIQNKEIQKQRWKSKNEY